VMVIVEKLVEWRLAGETEGLGENLPQSHFVHHKSHMTRPRFEPGPPAAPSLWPRTVAERGGLRSAGSLELRLLNEWWDEMPQHWTRRSQTQEI
jgi:hypothetical protein